MLLFLAVSCAWSAQPSSADAIVVMKGIAFQPAQLTVHVGETVEWKNEDIVAHTVTANDGSFDSGLIQPGGTWKMTVQKSGTIDYHCRPHPNMTAKLVEAAAAATQQGSAEHHGLPGFTFPKSPQELHPILVNFTAALLPLAFLSDLLGRALRRKSLHSAAAWMVLYAALITPLTAVAGLLWKRQSAGTLPAGMIVVHQWLGISLALAFVVLAIWRWSIQKREQTPGAAYLLFNAITVLALVYQGSLGGAMVFGH